MEFLSRTVLWKEVKSVPPEKRTEKLLSYIKGQVNRKTHDIDEKELKQCIALFLSKLNLKWTKHCRHEERFQEDPWLDGAMASSFLLPHSPIPQSPVPGPGRPRQAFHELSASGKRKRVAPLLASTDPAELNFAAEANKKKIGEGSNSNPGSTSRRHPEIPQISPDQALALISQAKLTRSQYTFVKTLLKENGCDVLPCYQRVLKSKEECYPAPASVEVKENKATISLQGIADLSASRLVATLLPVVESREEQGFVLLWKYGFDGSSDHSIYQQKTTGDMDESRLLFSAAVMLQLYARLPNGELCLLWQNERPGSTRSCRPIGFQHTKETQEVTLATSQNLKAEISALKSTEICLENKRVISISHSFIESMVDGKVVGTLDDVANSKCNVCGAGPAILNKIDQVLRRPENPKALQRGLPTTHLWIRGCEHMLHVANRLEIQKFNVTLSAQEKEQESSRKQLIQKNLRDKVGILVDMPRSGGKGNSTTGNVARRFFGNPHVTAEATGLDSSLLDQLRIVLNTIASGFAADVTLFRIFAEGTARKYVDIYGWYPMSPTMHKMLLHGHSFMAVSPVPLGLLTEEPLECRHKDLRYYRRNHTRKCSRVEGNMDLLHTLLVSSDPVINGLRKTPKKRMYHLDREVLKLLKPPTMIRSITDFTIEDDSEPDEF